jgi:hypothetical protein
MSSTFDVWDRCTIDGHAVALYTWMPSAGTPHIEVWIDDHFRGHAADGFPRVTGFDNIFSLIDLWFNSTLRDTMPFSEFHKGLALE